MKSTSSIARKINIGFWFEQLFTYIAFDILLIAVCAGTFFFTVESMIPKETVVIERYLTDGVNEIIFDRNNNVLNDRINIFNLKYVIVTENGKLEYSMGSLINPALNVGIVILAVEAVSLFSRLFGAGKIRHQLRPYNELAKQAEKISSIAADDSKFMTLENAISNINPDQPDAKISTGNKDLRSLEIAINNLIDKMRDNYKQQIRFVSDASHELRTPISVIQGYVNMLDRWGKNDEKILDESIEALKNESEHMKKLVEQLLFLARGDSGRNILKMENFDLSRVVREVCEESMMIDSLHKYEFRGTEDVMMNGDLSMIKQSIRIFADNAAKYSREGDTIIFDVRKNDDTVSYMVQDEGVGMAESDVVHVFERFYRSDSARNSKTGGTGLGLSIAKWIVDAHGGEINILSREDFGTRFTIVFNQKISRIST